MGFLKLELIKKLDGFRDTVLKLQIVDIDHFVFECELSFESHRLQKLVVGLPERLVKYVTLVVFANLVGSRVDHRVVLEHFHE